MKNNFIAIITFFFASGYVLFLDYLAVSSRSLQRTLVLPLFILIFILYLYRSSFPKWKAFLIGQGVWISLFWITVFVQLLVLATGGLKSPFFILIHLFMIGFSFLFQFSTSLLFLVFSFIVIFADAAHHDLFATLFVYPTDIVLQSISLVAIIPLAYIIAQQYHGKDLLFRIMQTKMKTNEAILESLQELIILTDPQLHILSINDAVEKALHRSRSELIDRSLFDILLLRDSNGKLMKGENFFLEGDTSQPQKNPLKEFTLLASSTFQSKVTLQIHPIKPAGNDISQISFIIRYVNAPDTTPAIPFDNARAKYEALAQNIKKKLLTKNLKKIEMEMILLEKIEQDTYILQTLKNNRTNNITTHINLAELCKKAVLLDQEFAKSFHVSLDFTLQNFGMKDIAPLTVADYPVKPEQLTGPFFTVECDVKQVEIVVKKILDIAVFMSSGTPSSQVMLSVERGANDDIVIAIRCSAPILKKESLTEIFEPYYGKLASKTDLHAGSGLEGYIIKQITQALDLSFAVNYEETPTEQIQFTLKIPKKPQK